MNPRNRLSIAAVAAVTCLALAGCGDDAAPDGSDTSPTSETSATDDATSPDTTTTPDPTETGSPDASAGAEAALAAIAAAESETGGTAFELDDEDFGWEVSVAVDGTEVEVRTDSAGSVTGSAEEGDVDSDDLAGLDAATISISDAITTAAGEASGDVREVDLDDHRGTHVWEVVLREGTTETEVRVDVATGEVISTETDTDDD